MPQDSAQLGLHRDAHRVGQGRHGLDGADVLLQREARAVDHERLVPQGQRLAKDGQIVDAQVIFIDHRDVIQVQADKIGLAPGGKLTGHREQALAFELDPFQTRGFDQRKGIRIDDRLDDRFHHGQVGNVESGDGHPQAASLDDDLSDTAARIFSGHDWISILWQRHVEVQIMAQGFDQRSLHAPGRDGDMVAVAVDADVQEDILQLADLRHPGDAEEIERGWDRR